MSLSFRGYLLLIEGNVWQDVANKFIQELVHSGQGLQQATDIVKNYIEKFKVIRQQHAAKLKNVQINVPIEKRGDISAYPTFHDLEVAVDYVEGQVNTRKSQGEKVDVNGYKIFGNNVIEIYHGNSREACIHIKGQHDASWCISRSDSSNMYNSYRYHTGEPSFYFVKNLYKLQNDPTDRYSFFVIQKLKGDNGVWPYRVTSRYNDGDTQMSWEQIVKIEPNLRGLGNLFKHYPVSGEDRVIYNRFKNGISDEEFKKLTYKEKEQYIDVKLKLTDEQFHDCPDDLKNKYIGIGRELTLNQINEIKNDKKLCERYVDVCNRNKILSTLIERTFWYLKYTNDAKSVEGAESQIKRIEKLLEIGVKPIGEELMQASWEFLNDSHNTYRSPLVLEVLKLLLNAGAKLRNDQFWEFDFRIYSNEKHDHFREKLIELLLKYNAYTLSKDDFYYILGKAQDRHSRLEQVNFIDAIRSLLDHGIKPDKKVLTYAYQKVPDKIFELLQKAYHGSN